MKRALIIDEENISVRGIIYLIESKFPGKLATHVSKTCSSGLKELSANRYDLLILDMMLPAGDWPIKAERPDNLYGIDLLAEITQKHKSLPVICYTVLDNNSIRGQVERFNGYYLCKNGLNSREELVKLINNLLYK